MIQKNYHRTKLKPVELHQIWEGLNEEQRVPFLAALSEEAAEDLLQFQVRQHERAAARAEMSSQRAPAKRQHEREDARSERRTVAVNHTPQAEPQPWPDGDPQGWWTTDELNAYLTFYERQMVAAQGPSQASTGEPI